MAQPHPSSSLLCVGQINSPHGVRGDVKIKLFTESTDSFKQLLPHLVNSDGQAVRVHLRSFSRDMAIAQLEAVHSREEAEAYKGHKLYVERRHLPDIQDPSAFYIEDLKGMLVKNTAGDDIGTVFDCVNYGAGDILEVTLASGKRELILFHDDNFPEVNVKEGYMILNPPEEIIASKEHDELLK